MSQAPINRAIRQALGLPVPAAERPAPFFGTYRALLQLFGAGIAHQQRLQEARAKVRRRGVSAKSAYAREKGKLPHPPRRARATGPGSYAA